MNINLRALVFGVAVAAALTTAIDVVAAEHVAAARIARADTTRHGLDADAQVIRLEPVIVTAHKGMA